MKSFKAMFTILFLLMAGTAAEAQDVDVCSNDKLTTERIEEARAAKGVLEIPLLDLEGRNVGSLFTSDGQQLSGHAIYICGASDNYYYVNSDDIRQWVGKEVGEWKMISAIRTHHTPNADLIHHDEALVSASVETLDITPKAAQVRMVFQAWNFANEVASQGVLYFQIPL